MKMTAINRGELSASDIMRFESKVSRMESGCLEWIGGRDKLGYGRFKFRGRMLMSHRVSMAIRHGDLPVGLVVDHLCRNPACVDPEHLEMVTLGENTARGLSPLAPAIRNAAIGEACINGHHRAQYGAQDKSGRVRCRECGRLNSARRDARDRLDPERKERKRIFARQARAEGRWK